MSSRYLTSLAVAAAIILGVRLFLPDLPLNRFTRSLPRFDGAVLVLGLLGLVFHCGAMFFSSSFGAVPGTDGAIRLIDGMAGGSIAWYVVAAALVIAGMRRQWLFAVFALCVVLIAVGITMFDGGPLNLHLTAIFIAVILLIAELSFLARSGNVTSAVS